MIELILLLILAAIGFSILALGAWVADRPAPPARPPRPKIPAREAHLLGDDYRACIAPFKMRRRSAERIIREVCDLD